MLTVLLFLLPQATSAEPPAFDALLAEATASNTPIVLDVFTSWCAPCAMMEKNVFPEPAVAAMLSKVRFVRYDAERGPGVDVAARFGISSYPSLLVLTPDGTLVDKVSSQAPADFVAEMSPLLTIAATKGPFTDEALAKKDTDARALFVGALIASRASPLNQTRSLGLLDRAVAADADGHLGIKGRAASLAVRARFAAGLEALKVKALLELAQNGAPSTATAALGTLASMNGVDRSKTRALAEALRTKLVTAKDTSALNELIYAQLALHELEGALDTAKALEALNPGPVTMDTVAEAYFQAGQKERAVEREEGVIRDLEKTGRVDPALRDNLRRFKTEAPKPPPYTGDNPLEVAATHSGPAMPAFFVEAQQLAATLADDCRAAAGKTTSTYVRLAFTGAQITRAVAFDLEAPPALRTCLEKKARTKSVTALMGHSPWTLEVRFGPHS
jgi:thiol-disulfide isomerase/thioredoxin